MENNLTSIVHQWLSKADIRVSKSYLNHKLSSHPSYPSIVSITDTLDELGIENAALVVDKEKLSEIPVPFLINANGKGTSFFLINDMQKLLTEKPEFLKQWDGIVIVMEKPPSFSDAENNSWLSRERSTMKLFSVTILLLLLLSIAAVSFEFDWLVAVLLLLIVAGITISTLVVQHELGIANDFTKQLCTAGKNTDCNAVLESRHSSLFGWLNFSDLGIIWYSSQFLLITSALFTSSTSQAIPFIALLTIAGFPITILSLYYQHFVIKKWCTLCLITIILIWMQTGLLWQQLPLIEFNFQLLKTAGFIGIILLSVFAIWILSLKPMLINQRQLTEMNFRLQRFKYNSYIFETVLQRKPPAEIVQWSNDLQLGNPDSPIQITVACNPYCSPCATAHEILHEIVERRSIGLTIRFTLLVNKEDKITKAVEYILQLLKDKPIAYKRKALHSWYSHMNMDIFVREYPLPGTTDVNELLRQHESWSKKMAVRFTPTIFINGYQLPGAYSISDLPILISGLLSKNETAIEKKEEEPILI